MTPASVELLAARGFNAVRFTLETLLTRECLDVAEELDDEWSLAPASPNLGALRDGLRLALLGKALREWGTSPAWPGAVTLVARHHETARDARIATQRALELVRRGPAPFAGGRGQILPSELEIMVAFMGLTLARWTDETEAELRTVGWLPAFACSAGGSLGQLGAQVLVEAFGLEPGAVAVRKRMLDDLLAELAARA